MRVAPFVLVSFAMLALGCGSKTSDKIAAFATRVCACTDAACAQGVQAEYLTWWKENKSAGGLDGERKEVEDAMARYAKCHLDLVGPEASAPKPAPVARPNVAPATLAPVQPGSVQPGSVQSGSVQPASKVEPEASKKSKTPTTNP